MITFTRSTDYPLIRQIITHPRIYPHVTDDFSPAIEDYQPLELDGIWYVIVREEKELLGLWTLVPHNAICWEIHTTLLPNAWGERARTAAKMLGEWLWQNTPCRRVITEVPEYNTIALKFALMAGMQQYGTNHKSFQKDGKLHDVILLGTSKPEVN